MNNSNLTEGPISGHLRRIAVPYAVGMAFVILFGLVDTYFAGLLSTDALAALAISFPIFFILTAIGMGINAAVTALIGNALGAGDSDYAKRLSTQGVSYSLAVSIILAVIGFLVVEPLARVISSETAVLSLTVEYLNILIFSLPAFLVFACANGILLAQGNAVIVMRAHIGNLVANIILTPLMMFGIPGTIEGLGFPGIALSTLVSQTFVMLYVMRAAVKSDVWTNGGVAIYRPNADDYRDITAQALPAGIALAIVLFSGYIVQIFLRDFGTHMIAAFGVAIRIEQLVLLPGVALAYSLRPVISQNFGAGKYDRVREAAIWCFKQGALLMAGAAVVLAVSSRVTIGWFADDPEVVNAGVQILVILAALMPFVFLVLAVNSVLQGLKRPVWVLIIILYERLFSLIAFCVLFVVVLDFGIWGVWSGLAASGVTGCLFALAVVSRVGRQELQNKEA